MLFSDAFNSHGDLDQAINCVKIDLIKNQVAGE